MTAPSPDAHPRLIRDPIVRIVAAIADSDAEVFERLRADGFQIERATPSEIDTLAARAGADALVLDVDLEGSLGAVARVRRADSVLSAVPIVFVGRAALRTSLDAVEAGADAFIARPLSSHTLAYRLHTLLELPGAESLRPGTQPPNTLVPARGSSPGIPLPPSLAPSPPPHGLQRNGDNGSGLSPGLEAVLRSAAARAGSSESELSLPSVGDDSVDDLIPPELLEPLDAPLDTLGDDALALSGQHTPPPYSPHAPSRRPPPPRGAHVPSRTSPPTPTLTPLPIAGETRLSGALGRFGAGILLGAAARARASGLLVLRSRGEEYGLALTSGHLLAVRSSRPEHDAGALLTRLGFIPHEAARFAAAPLEAGVRGAALVAARGYMTAEALATALGRAAREVVFDLLTLPELEWEMRTLEAAAEVPLSPRSVDALLVLGARARVEPPDALAAIGGADARLSLKAEAAALAALPLTRAELDAAVGSRGAPAASIVNSFGGDVLPALLALAWLGALRVEGAEAALAAAAIAPSHERTRARALLEAAERRDHFALLGVSEWATRGAALDALDARRTELSGLLARVGDPAPFAPVHAALDELASLLEDPAAWSSYAAALRVRSP